MIVIALQGLKPRVGTSSVAAALTYLLSQRLSKVLAVDCAQGTGGLDVQFGLYDKQTGQNAPTGWLNALREGLDPLSCAWRYEGECFYLPQGRLLSPAAAAAAEKTADPTNTTDAAAAASPKEALALLERLRTLNFSYAVLDLGVRESALAQALAAQADLSVTVVEVDGNCFLGLQSLRLGPREVLLLNKFDPRSHVCNDLDLVIRDNAGAGNVLRALIPLDESLRESLLQLQCVARYQPIAASTREIERAMIEIMLLSGDEGQDPEMAGPTDSSPTAKAAAEVAASDSATPAPSAAGSAAESSAAENADVTGAASSSAVQGSSTPELSPQRATASDTAPESSQTNNTGSSS